MRTKVESIEKKLKSAPIHLVQAAPKGDACPHCKRKYPKAKGAAKIDKRLAQDIERANRSIASSMKALVNPWFVEKHDFQTQEMADAVRRSISDGIEHSQRSLNDHRLLWRTYRRLDKGVPYYETATELPIAA